MTNKNIDNDNTSLLKAKEPQKMTKNAPTKNAPTKNGPTEKELMKKLLDFYWEILKDTDLKPADRIASAKRLEALLMAQNSAQTIPVTVTLNLPDATVTRGHITTPKGKPDA